MRDFWEEEKRRRTRALPCSVFKGQGEKSADCFDEVQVPSPRPRRNRDIDTMRIGIAVYFLIVLSAFYFYFGVC